MISLAWLAALTLSEILLFSLWLDGAALAGRPGIAGAIGDWGAWILRGGVGFLAAYLAFAGLTSAVSLSELRKLLPSRFAARWLYLHAACVLLFAVTAAALYGNWPNISYPNGLAVLWIVAALSVPVTSIAAFTSRSLWSHLIERTGSAGLYALVVTLLALGFVQASQSLWTATARTTFELVRFLLDPIFPDLIVEPERLRLRAPNFGVIIDQSCSGLEGAGLMLAFTAGWLMLQRHEFRFPRSLLLIPSGILVLYLLNAVRIAALLIIGNAGAPQIAAGGFHSQAGWIAFNGVALGMTVLVPRVQWLRVHPRRRSMQPLENANPNAPFLIPFLAILAAGMIARAASASFEWLYPLRLIAAFAALWYFRRTLRTLDWTPGWRGVVAGLGVFALWVGLDWWQGRLSAHMPLALAMASPGLRTGWIAIRAIAAVTTVPIAEELAFRGFLLRQFGPVHFDQLPFQRATWAGVVVSSLAFGFLHGDRWLAGIFAGLLYTWAAYRSNRIGDAVLGHALTNALLDLQVLVLGQWQYW